jgi:hypothetical protein
MSKTLTLVFLTAFATFGLQLTAAVIPPIGLAPGSRYQLIFVTADTHDALSAIETPYNAFVTAEAAQNPLLPSTRWFAVASTEDGTDARLNARFLALPVYNTAGQLVATGAVGLYPVTFQPLLAPIAYDQYGVDPGPRYVWTGSGVNGGLATGLGLGSEIVSASPTSAAGNSGSMDTGWMSNAPLTPTDQLSFYALSSAIRFVPEPATLTLLGLAVLMIGGIRLLRWRRNR